MGNSILTFDRLNTFVGYKRSEPFRDFYAPMRITLSQKRKREKIASDIEDIMIAMLANLFYGRQYGVDVGYDTIERTKSEYIRILKKYLLSSEYLENHFDLLLNKIAEATYRNTSLTQLSESDMEDKNAVSELYYYSKDRARLISENEANTIYNYDEYEDAIERYSLKKWNTIIDGRERDSHNEMNGVTIPIDELFELRGGLMAFPRDDEYDASEDEIAGCRCSLSFS